MCDFCGCIGIIIILFQIFKEYMTLVLCIKNSGERWTTTKPNIESTGVWLYTPLPQEGHLYYNKCGVID